MYRVFDRRIIMSGAAARTGKESKKEKKNLLKEQKEGCGRNITTSTRERVAIFIKQIQM